MIMRWLIRLAFPALGLLLVLIFFGINDPETATQPSAAQVDTRIPAFEGEVPAPIPDHGPAIVFKWQDTDGNWHYADKPPKQGPWNALAIEPGPGTTTPGPAPGSPDDWQSPYSAPFSLRQDLPHNDS